MVYKNKLRAFILCLAGNVDYFHDINILYWFMYLADREHLVRYGRTISRDRYKVLEDGIIPVAISKELNDPDYNYLEEAEKDEAYDLVAMHLSDSDREIINISLSKYTNKSEEELKKEVFGKAYKKAKKNCEEFIDIVDMAKEAGATRNMVKYIQEMIDIDKFITRAWENIQKKK